MAETGVDALLAEVSDVDELQHVVLNKLYVVSHAPLTNSEKCLLYVALRRNICCQFQIHHCECVDAQNRIHVENPHYCIVSRDLLASDISELSREAAVGLSSDDISILSDKFLETGKSMTLDDVVQEVSRLEAENELYPQELTSLEDVEPDNEDPSRPSPTQSDRSRSPDKTRSRSRSRDRSEGTADARVDDVREVEKRAFREEEGFPRDHRFQGRPDRKRGPRNDPFFIHLDLTQLTYEEYVDRYYAECRRRFHMDQQHQQQVHQHQQMMMSNAGPPPHFLHAPTPQPHQQQPFGIPPQAHQLFPVPGPYGMY